ncbi:MAG: gliding motility-associated C-terminal domain-containing protein, partial [Chitinophagales bacterium]
GENGCTSETISTSIEVENPLPEPEVSCGALSPTSVSFVWDAIAGVTNYEITVTVVSVVDGSSTVTFPTAPTSSTVYEESDLSPGDAVTIELSAIGGGVCGNSVVVTETCIASDCDVINPAIDMASTNFCADDLALDLEATPTGGEFSIDGTVVTQFVPSNYDSGTYTIIYTFTENDGNCVYTDDIDVTVVALPVVTYNWPNTVCVGDVATIEFTGTVSTANNFSWDFDGGDPTTAQLEGPHDITWDTPGTKNINLEVSNLFADGSGGCFTSETFSIDVIAPLAIPEPMCSATAQDQVSFEWTAIDGAENYFITVTTTTFETGETMTFDAPPQTATTFTQTGLSPNDEVEIVVQALSSGVCGDSETGMATCTADDCPTVNPTIDNLDNNYCIDADEVVLQGTPAGGEFSIEEAGTGISTVITTLNPSDYSATTYTLTYLYTDQQCEYNTTQDVAITALPDAAFTLAANTLCLGDFAIAEVTNIVASNTYEWTFEDGATPDPTGTNNINMAFNTAGTKQITLNVTTPEGCVSTSSASIDVSTPLATPVVSCGELTTECVTFAWTAITGASNYAISYSTNSGTLTTDLASTNDYQVCGLFPQDVVEISVVAVGTPPCGDSEAGTGICIAQNCPPVDVQITNLPAQVCSNGTAVVLEGNTAAASFGVIMDADTMAITSFDPIDYAIGTYTIVYGYVEAATDCIYYTNGTIEVVEPTIVTISVDLMEVCVNESVMVSFDGDPILGGIYNWEFDGATINNGNDAGPYDLNWASSGIKMISLIMTDANGCTTNTATTMVNVVAPFDAPTPNCESTTDSTVSLIWNAVEGANAYEISYSINGGESANEQITETHFSIINLQPNDTVSFGVQAVGDGDCATSSQNSTTCITSVPVVEPPIIDPPFQAVAFPTAFSPNGDGRHDEFKPVGIGMESGQIRIFNRWGEEVFLSDDINVGWEGYKDGELVTAGSYVYSITVKMTDGTEKTYSGHVIVVF